MITSGRIDKLKEDRTANYQNKDMLALLKDAKEGCQVVQDFLNKCADRKEKIHREIRKLSKQIDDMSPSRLWLQEFSRNLSPDEKAASKKWEALKTEIEDLRFSQLNSCSKSFNDAIEKLKKNINESSENDILKIENNLKGLSASIFKYAILQEELQEKTTELETIFPYIQNLKAKLQALQDQKNELDRVRASKISLVKKMQENIKKSQQPISPIDSDSAFSAFSALSESFTSTLIDKETLDSYIIQENKLENSIGRNLSGRLKDAKAWKEAQDANEQEKFKKILQAEEAVLREKHTLDPQLETARQSFKPQMAMGSGSKKMLDLLGGPLLSKSDKKDEGDKVLMNSAKKDIALLDDKLQKCFAEIKKMNEIQIKEADYLNLGVADLRLLIKWEKEMTLLRSYEDPIINKSLKNCCELYYDSKDVQQLQTSVANYKAFVEKIERAIVESNKLKPFMTKMQRRIAYFENIEQDQGQDQNQAPSTVRPVL